MSELRIESVNKFFGGNHVLKGISMTVNKGELVSLLGPSGCGKTTLLKLIAGLERPTTGSLFIGGSCCDDVPARKRGAVLVFQDYGLFPHMTVRQNIEFGLAARGTAKAERAKKVGYISDIMQVADKAGAYPRELSGGQKQRVALARACVLEPNLLLLDEPFSSLDTSLKDTMREFVSDMQRGLGITTILVTHDREEAFMLSQRVAVMLDGQIHQFDQPEKIYASPISGQVADFIGEANYIDGSLSGGVFSCLFGNFETAVAGGQPRLMLRYDHFVSSRECREGWMPCKIVEKAFKGRTTTYRAVADHTSVCELKFNSPDSGLSPGDRVYLTVAEGAGRVLS